MRKRIRTVLESFLILGAGCGLLVAQSGAAGTYYVATNGAAPNDGAAWSTAFTNLQDAIDAAGADDTIYVAGQTFELDSQLTWDVSDLTMKGSYAATNDAAPGPYDFDQSPTVITPTYGSEIRLMGIESVENARIERVHFRDGNVTAELEGGAIRAENVTNLTFDACWFTGNTVYRTDEVTIKGGAIWASNVDGLSINDSRFMDNSLDLRDKGYAVGGALYALYSDGVVSNTVFTANKAMGNDIHAFAFGGALTLYGNWDLDGVVIANNVAQAGTYRDAFGGGMYLYVGAYRVHNSLICDNRMTAGDEIEGAAIYARSDAEVELSNVTLANNVGGAGLYNAGSQVQLRNSILYGNRGSDVRSASPPTLSHCLVGDGTGAGSNGNFAADPLFESPLFYLSVGSPATNSGDRSASSAGLDSKTTSRDGALDAGTVNLGYHYAEGVVFDLDLYVTESGDDGNDGESPAQALRSITRALELAAARTQIHVGAGQYTNGVETFPLCINGQCIQLLGSGRSETVIDATGAGKRVLELSDTRGDTRIEGLTVTGGDNTATARGGGIWMHNATVALVDVEISDNQQRLASEYNYGCGMFAELSSGILRDAIISDNLGGNSGDWKRQAYGGGAWLSGTWTLRDTIISGNVAYAGAYSRTARGGGLWLDGGIFLLRDVRVDNNAGVGGGDIEAQAGGIWAAADAHVTLENATVADNDPEGLWGNVNSTVHNSILWNNGIADHFGMAESAFWYSNASNLTAGVQGNLSEDPRFVDAGNGDYRLSDDAGSPCINAGEIVTWMKGAVDLAGNPRVMGGSVDMGAYETRPPYGTLFMVY